MVKRDIHVVPHPDGWAVRKEGADRASSVHRTQEKALDQARHQGRQEHVEVVTHGADGKIRDSDSYGPDPCPPKDRRH
jgi:hypothetical protein